MTAKDLNGLLDNHIMVEDFKSSIADEIDNYERLMKIKGSTIDLRFTENEDVHLDKLRFGKLLDLVITDRLSNVHLAYICDCLTLTENLIADEKTMELIFEIADPEIKKGYLDKETLKDMVSNID